MTDHGALIIPTKSCLDAEKLCSEEEQIRNVHWGERTDGFQKKTLLSTAFLPSWQNLSFCQ